MDLNYEVYHGIILPDHDAKENRGRYKVFIPSRHHNIPETQGIWCKNRVHPYRLTYSVDGLYGQYFPLHKDTKVLVAFIANDYSNGEIIKIISDPYPDTLPLNWEFINRDDMYQLMRTPKHNNIFLINEDTDGVEGDVTPNSWHMYYDNMSIKQIWNDDGYQIYNDENLAVTHEKDSDVVINGNSYEKVQLDEETVIQSNSYREVYMNDHKYVGRENDTLIDGEVRKKSNKNINVVAGKNIYMDALSTDIHLNSRLAAHAKPKELEPTKGYDTYPLKPKELHFDLEVPEYGVIKTVLEWIDLDDSYCGV